MCSVGRGLMLDGCLNLYLRHGPKNDEGVSDSHRQPLDFLGSPTWARTRDLRINSPALYQLSYRGTEPAIIASPALAQKRGLQRGAPGARRQRVQVDVAELVGRLLPGAAVGDVVDAQRARSACVPPTRLRVAQRRGRCGSSPAMRDAVVGQHHAVAFVRDAGPAAPGRARRDAGSRPAACSAALGHVGRPQAVDRRVGRAFAARVAAACALPSQRPARRRASRPRLRCRGGVRCRRCARVQRRGRRRRSPMSVDQRPVDVEQRRAPRPARRRACLRPSSIWRLFSAGSAWPALM